MVQAKHKKREHWPYICMGNHLLAMCSYAIPDETLGLSLETPYSFIAILDSMDGKLEFVCIS
jgi:hypothetical protein